MCEEQHQKTYQSELALGTKPESELKNNWIIGKQGKIENKSVEINMFIKSNFKRQNMKSILHLTNFNAF